MNTDKLMKEILDSFKLIDSNEIPNIPLYMDQVTTFMDEHLHHPKHSDDEKILTKTMINNYAKNKLLPSPEKKRYTKNHLILLTFIYYFKNVMPINDIKVILNEISDKYFSSSDAPTLSDIYDEISKLQQRDLEFIRKDIEAKKQLAEQTFSSADSDDEEFLRLFSLICMLSFDVYVKKQLIESIIDQMNPTD